MTLRPFLRRCTTVGLPILRQNYLKCGQKSLVTFKEVCLINRKFNQPQIKHQYLTCTSVRYVSSKNEDSPTETKVKTETEEPPQKLGLIARFKQMYRDYWYVLVPVHLVTSIGWFTSFYYMAKSGVDIASMLESIGISERWAGHFRDSSMGYVAVSYGLYKIATPIRYTVTLTGTTLSIKYLTKYGYIKPVPSKEKVKEIIKNQKENMKNTIRETKEELRQRKMQLKERKDNIMCDYANFKKELKDIKTKLGKMRRNETKE